MPENVMTLLNLYVIFNISLLFFSGYIFLRMTPDIMKSLEYRCFRVFILVFQLYLVSETLRTLHHYGMIDVPQNVHAGICFASLLLAVGNAFMFYLTLLMHIDSSYLKQMRAVVAGTVPLLVALLLLTISLFNGFIFNADLSHMERGSFYYLLPLISFIYLFLAVRVSVNKARATKTKEANREALSTIVTVILLIAWVVLDNTFDGTTILPIAIFAVILHMFISFQQSGIYTDTLTGMNNRRKAEIYLGSEISSSNSGDMPLYIFMGDINGFKKINDEYGHYEGDCALIIFAEAVKKTAEAYKGFIARYGGDEFVWAWRPVKGGDFDPEMVIEDIRHRVAAECVSEHKPYTISLAIGYVICDDPKRPINAYLKDADGKMYADKEGHYRNKKA